MNFWIASVILLSPSEEQRVPLAPPEGEHSCSHTVRHTRTLCELTYAWRVRKPITSVWTREKRPSKSPTLSRAQIVRAAMEILDTEGMDALSMRRLGSRLGAGATSIYWHVAHKDELLELV